MWPTSVFLLSVVDIKKTRKSWFIPLVEKSVNVYYPAHSLMFFGEDWILLSIMQGMLKVLIWDFLTSFYYNYLYFGCSLHRLKTMIHHFFLIKLFAVVYFLATAFQILVISCILPLIYSGEALIQLKKIQNTTEKRQRYGMNYWLSKI